MAAGWTTRKGSTARLLQKICYCGNSFQTYISKNSKYCSMACRSAHPEYRAELSRTAIGKRDVRGDKNPRWKGGTSDFRNRFQSTVAYKQWRKAVYERDGYSCVECHEPGNGKNLNADHILPFSTHPDLRLDINNGRTLCIDCHKKTPTYGWKLYNANR